MKRRLAVILPVGVALVAAVYAFYRFLFPSDPEAIRRLMTEAADAASWESGAGLIARQSAASRLAAFCTDDVEIHVEGLGSSDAVLHGRGDIRQAALAARYRAAYFRIALSDLEIQVTAPGQSATVLLVATARLAGVNEPLIQEYRLELVKQDGEWLIRRAEPIRGFGM
jgi:hypothetical protein